MIYGGSEESTTEMSIYPTTESAFSASQDPTLTRRHLTARQLMALRFVHEHTKIHGYPPTLREIGKHMGISSTNGVNDHLRALERKGCITRADMLSRCIRLTVKGLGAVGEVTTSAAIADAVESDVRERVVRQQQLLIRVLSLLQHVAPTTPLISEIHKEIA